MKDRLSRFPSLFFSAGKKMDDLFSLLQQIAEEQRNSRAKIEAIEVRLAQQEQFREQFREQLQNRCRLMEEHLESLRKQGDALLLTFRNGEDAIGKHLNTISNTQNANFQEILGYFKDHISTANKIYDLANFARSALAAAPEWTQGIRNLKEETEKQKTEGAAFHTALANLASLLQKQGTALETLLAQAEKTLHLSEEQKQLADGHTDSLANTESILHETSQKLDSLRDAANKSLELQQEQSSGMNLIRQEAADWHRNQDAAMEQVLHTAGDLAQTADAASKRMEELQKRAIQTTIQAKWMLADDIAGENGEQQERIIRCPLCGHSDRKSGYSIKRTTCIFGGGKIERYVCPECDLIFGPLKMLELSPQQLQEEYEQNYSVFRESDTTQYELALFHAMKPEKDRLYLNYGAGGWNTTSRQLREEGFQVYDYEPFAPVPNRKWTITSKAELQKMKFDRIFSNDLIEHLRFPVEELRFMRGLLKEDGAMYHATGCYEYAFEYTRFHLFFFTGRSLRLLAEKSGLKVTLTDRIYPERSSLRYAIFTINKTELQTGKT